MFWLREGTIAVILYDGDFAYTLRVVETFEDSDDFARFETMNTIYGVALVPSLVTLAILEIYAKSA